MLVNVVYGCPLKSHGKVFHTIEAQHKSSPNGIDNKQRGLLYSKSCKSVFSTSICQKLVLSEKYLGNKTKSFMLYKWKNNNHLFTIIIPKYIGFHEIYKTFASITCFYIYINSQDIDINFQTYCSSKNTRKMALAVGQQVAISVTRLACIVSAV